MARRKSVLSERVVHVDHQRIRYLYEAWQRGSMRAASEALNLAPSSISRQIALLESELDSLMIERSRREIRLTEAGRQVIAYYQDVLANQEALVAHLHDLSGMRTGTVTIALGESFLGETLYACLDEFRQKFPGISLIAKLTDTTEILSLLANDEAHFGLVFHPPPDAAVSLHYSQVVPLVAITAPGHPLTRLSRVSLGALQAYPLALTEMRFRMRQLLHMAEVKAGLHLEPAITTNSMELLRQLVRRGSAITILPAFCVGDDVRSGGLIATEINEPLLNDTRTHVLTRGGRRLSPAARHLMQMVGSRLRAAVQTTSMGR